MAREEEVGDLAVRVSAETDRFRREMRREVTDEAVDAGQRAGGEFGDEFSDRAERKTDVDLNESVEAGAAGAAAGETYSEAFESRAEEIDLSNVDLDLDMDTLMAQNKLPTTLEATGEAAEEAADGLDEMGDAAEDDVGRVNNLGQELKVLRKILQSLERMPATAKVGGAGIIGSILYGSVASLVAGGATVGGAILSGRLNEQLQELQALLPGLANNMAGVRAEIALMAQQTGETPRALTKQLYTASEAGVRDLDEALNTVRTSAQLKAAGAFDDLEKSMEAVLTVSRSMDVEFDNTARAAGTLLTITRQANATFEETVSFFEELGPRAADSGISMQELGAAFVTVTRRGNTAKQATDILDQRLTDLDETQGEARGSALAAAGATDEYRKAMEKTEGAAGKLQDAVDDANDDFLSQVKIVGQQLAEELRQMGDDVLPKVTAELEAWDAALDDADDGRIAQMEDRLNNLRASWGGLVEAVTTEGDDFWDNLLPETDRMERFTTSVGGFFEVLDNIATLDFGKEFEGDLQDILGDSPRARLRTLAPLAIPDNLGDLGDDRLGDISTRITRRQETLKDLRAEADRLGDTEAVKEINRMLEVRRQQQERILELRGMIEDSEEGTTDEVVDRSEIYRANLDLMEQELEVQESRLRNTAELTQKIGIDVPGLRPDGPTQPLDTADTQAAMRELEPMLQETGTTAADVQEILDEYGVTLDELAQEQGKAGKRAKQAALAIMGFGERSEESEEKTSDLRDTIRDVSRAASGVLQLAEAMGVVDEETGKALQSMTQLAASAAQFASGNIAAGIASGAGGLAGIVRLATQKSDREKVVERNTEALLALRQDLEKLRSVIEGTPGDVLEAREELADLVERIPEEFGPLPENALPGDRPFGTSEDDFIGESEATKGEVEAALGDIGLSFTELKALSDRLGVSIENITKAMNEGEASADGVRQEFISLNKAMQELKLEELFAGFEGQMAEIQDRFELFDVEKPINKLEELRTKFLEFVELPGELEKQLAGADLSTAEGRRRFRQTLQQIFEMLASGQLQPEELGGLTPGQLRDTLKQLEGLEDEIGGEGESGSTSAFQVSRQITEVTGNRIVGVLTTLSVLARQRNRMVMGIAQKMGASVPESIRPPSRPQGGTGTTVNREGDIVLQMPKGAVVIEADGRLTRKDGEEAAHGFVDVIDRRLGGVTAGEERREGEV